MKKGGGPRKGAQFEREVCKAFSRWISYEQRDDIFWRTAMSGGRATLAKKAGDEERVAQAGDITCIDNIGRGFAERFVVECKFVKDLQLQNIFKPTGGAIKDYIKQSIEQTPKGKSWLLVAKQNGMKPLFIMSKHDYGQYVGHGSWGVMSGDETRVGEAGMINIFAHARVTYDLQSPVTKQPYKANLVVIIGDFESLLELWDPEPFIPAPFIHTRKRQRASKI